METEASSTQCLLVCGTPRASRPSWQSESIIVRSGTRVAGVPGEEGGLVCSPGDAGSKGSNSVAVSLFWRQEMPCRLCVTWL